jgi:hypothetical protein
MKMARPAPDGLYQSESAASQEGLGHGLPLRPAYRFVAEHTRGGRREREGAEGVVACFSPGDGIVNYGTTSKTTLLDFNIGP